MPAGRGWSRPGGPSEIPAWVGATPVMKTYPQVPTPSIPGPYGSEECSFLGISHETPDQTQMLTLNGETPGKKFSSERPRISLSKLQNPSQASSQICEINNQTDGLSSLKRIYFGFHLLTM